MEFADDVTPVWVELGRVQLVRVDPSAGVAIVQDGIAMLLEPHDDHRHYHARPLTPERQAVRRRWHAAEVLGFQPDTLDPNHVAITAACVL